MKTFNNNVIDTDSYKLGHEPQRPVENGNMLYYIEPRYHDGSFNVGTTVQVPDYVIFAGLQEKLQKLAKGFTLEDVEFTDKYFSKHVPWWNKESWVRLYNKHGGHFPLRIRAVPEGTKVGLSNVIITFESTDPEFSWLMGWFETRFIRVWFPTNVATLSNLIKNDFIKNWKETSDSPIESLDFKLHDFGSRGTEVPESAAIGGAAHLMNFMGTDTTIALPFIDEVYGVTGDVAGFSVTAAEHSTILPWGKDKEAEAYSHIINTFAKPGQIVSIVSDSYNHWNAVENIFGGVLKEQIVNSGGLVVIRPDSGDPTSTAVRTIEILMNKFGFTTNSKGYKVLPDCVRVIYGDGINRKSINSILNAMKINSQSIDNITFGMGGALLQQHNRDTFGFAMKPSAVEKNGVWVPCNKNPIDMPEKKSKGGRLDLLKTENGLVTGIEGRGESALVTVYENGELQNQTDFDSIRKRVQEGLVV